MKARIFTVTFLLMLPALMYGQRMRLVSGDLGFLKGVKKVNVVYDYDNMSVGKFKDEEDYVNKKVKEYNDKEAGRGDNWKKSWEGDRESRFEPKFEELFNKYMEKYGLEVGDYEDAEYTLILKTTHTEPGFNVGVARRPAHTNMEAVFVSSDNSEPKAVVTLEGSPGGGAMGYDFDTGFRLQESYAKAGKELAKYIIKNGLK